MASSVSRVLTSEPKARPAIASTVYRIRSDCRSISAPPVAAFFHRLSSRATTVTREFALLADAFDYSLEDVRRLTINAAKSVFAPYAVRRAMVQRIAVAG